MAAAATVSIKACKAPVQPVMKLRSRIAQRTKEILVEKGDTEAEEAGHTEAEEGHTEAEGGDSEAEAEAGNTNVDDDVHCKSAAPKRGAQCVGLARASN